MSTADSHAHDPVLDLVTLCIEAIERGEPDPVPRVCAAAPDLEPAVRERLDQLREIGFVGPDDPEEDGSFDPYRIVCRIGSGGMGTVWLAKQAEPVERTVALKVVKRGMDSAEILSRFAAERRALARLSHPNIANIYDAGSLPNGRPYFAMEFVDGKSIVEHADTERLDVAARLELMLAVCDAVEHAHQRGIIHRDLKPSNILVTKHGEVATPKVIDFGVAKAIDATEAQRTMWTAAGQMLGTPEYMSPEQACDTADDVDTRTDVYALGVVLYELLTGVLPFEITDLRRGGWDKIRQVLREAEPPRPSSRIETSTESGREIASRCRTSATRLHRLLRGELDWVIIHALEKERELRYRSVAELGDDLRRHLCGEAVRAAPPSRWYRFRKLVHRNRVAVAIGLVLAVSAMTGAFGVLSGWNASDKAVNEAFAAIDTMLGRAAFLHVHAVPKAAEIEIELHREALATFERLRDLRGVDPRLERRIARSRERVAWCQLHSGRLDEAHAEYEVVRDAYEALGGGASGSPVALSHARTGVEILSLHRAQLRSARSADSLRGLFEATRRTLERLVAAGADDGAPLRWLVHLNLTFAHHLSAKGDEHAVRLRAAMELSEQLVERWPDDPRNFQQAAAAARNAAFMRATRSDPEAALGLVERALELSSRALEAEPQNFTFRQAHAGASRLRGQVLLDLGDDSAAEEALREAVEVFDALMSDFPGSALPLDQSAEAVASLAMSIGRQHGVTDEWRSLLERALTLNTRARERGTTTASSDRLRRETCYRLLVDLRSRQTAVGDPRVAELFAVLVAVPGGEALATQVRQGWDP